MKIILYGAGKKGRSIYNFLKSQGLEGHIYGFCDKNAKEIGIIDNKNVWQSEELKEKDLVYCITIEDRKEREEIRKSLNNKQCIEFGDLANIFHLDKIKFNREFCAFYHLESMEDYFQSAETTLEVFWDPTSIFYKMFQKLDVTSIVELACGRGRHIPQIIDKAENIMLVDILEKNIDICKKRFGKYNNIKYYKNSGRDLKKLDSNAYTSLYSYDAMVHFELIDIYFYLLEIYRVLSPGGKALLHHSNYHADYKAGFSTAPQGRSFMSKKCFAYLSYRVGFNVLEQQTIDWGTDKKLDCVTLIKKPF